MQPHKSRPARSLANHFSTSICACNWRNSCGEIPERSFDILLPCTSQFTCNDFPLQIYYITFLGAKASISLIKARRTRKKIMLFLQKVHIIKLIRQKSRPASISQYSSVNQNSHISSITMSLRKKYVPQALSKHSTKLLALTALLHFCKRDTHSKRSFIINGLVRPLYTTPRKLFRNLLKYWPLPY